MSNFLQRQIARAGAGLPAVVRPRLASFFEPTPRDQPAPDLQTATLEIDAERPPAVIRPRGAPAAGRLEGPMPGPSLERRDEAADRVPPSPSRAGSELAGRPLEATSSRRDDDARAEPEAPRAPRAATSVIATVRSPIGETSVAAPRPAALEERPLPTPRRQAERRPLLAPSEPTSSRPVAPRPQANPVDAWSAPTPPTREVSSPGPLTRGPSRRALPLREPARPAAPTIEITIGRIEVKAASAAAPPTRRPAARGPSELETYLRGKAERRS